MDWLLRILTYRRLTASLFVVFLGLVGVGLVLPQRPLMTADDYQLFAKDWPNVVWLAETTGFDDVYRSLVMMTVFTVFIVQLLAYLALRARRVLSEATRPQLLAPETLPLQKELAGTAEDIGKLSQVLRRRRYQVMIQPDGLLLARKHRLAPLAGLVFHASFIVILIGGWFLKVREFNGTARLVEGQPFHGAAAEYDAFGPVGLSTSEMPSIAFTPTTIEPVFSETGRSIDVRCSVQVESGGVRRTEDIGVNRPLVEHGVDVLLMDYGLAPAISTRNVRSGNRLEGVCSKLMVWSPGLPEDSLRIRRPAATIQVRFFPDHAEGSDGSFSRSMKLANPVLELRLKSDSEEFPETTALLRPGEAMRFGKYELRLDELRKWGEFQIIRQEGTLLVLGFVLMMVGAFFRLFFVRRWISAQLSETGDHLRLGARAEYFPFSFHDEWEAILAEVRPTIDTSLQEH